MWRLNPRGHQALSRVHGWAVLLLAGVSSACGIAAIGLWRQRRWGYAIVVAGLSMHLVGDILSVVTGAEPRAIIGIPIVATLLVYLSRPRVRSAFTVEPTPALHHTIRKAAPDDLPAVTRCLAAAFEAYRDLYTPDAFRDTVLTPEGAERRFREMTVLVAEDESAEIVGTIAYQALESGEGHIRGMAVLPRLHGGGVAERLLSAAEAKMRDLGCVRATLDTTRHLQRAMRFYERHGYARTGVVRDYFGMDLIEYAKVLPGG
jgi:ribosomal protein S18 acetylase RimI-like enzyme